MTSSPLPPPSFETETLQSPRSPSHPHPQRYRVIISSGVGVRPSRSGGHKGEKTSPRVFVDGYPRYLGRVPSGSPRGGKGPTHSPEGSGSERTERTLRTKRRPRPEGVDTGGDVWAGVDNPPALTGPSVGRCRGEGWGSGGSVRVLHSEGTALVPGTVSGRQDRGPGRTRPSLPRPGPKVLKDLR